MFQTHLSRLIAPLALVAALAPASFSAAQSLDGNTQRATGARSLGSAAVAAPDLLQQSWELSLTYLHEGGAVRTSAPTGAVRGGSRSEDLSFIGSRDQMVLQGTVAPGERVEIFTTLPILLGQSTEDGTVLQGPRSGSSALGDLRIGARVSLIDQSESDWRWVLGGALITPTGTPEFAFGEERVRAAIFSQAGYHFNPVWSLGVEVGYHQNETAVFGDQMFGDYIHVGAAAFADLDDLRLFADLVGRAVIADRPPIADPRRGSMEVNVGARYFRHAFFVDAAIGAGILDNHLTPQWRAMVSVGTTGRMGRSQELRDADLDGIADDADQCPTQAEDYDGFEDSDGCPDIDNDGDGIVDDRDACPSSAEDFDGIADDDGCPESDADGDGILDEDDACPLAAEDFDGYEDTDGCPEAGSREMPVAGAQSAQSERVVRELSYSAVYFDTDAVRLDTAARNEVRSISALLLRYEGDIVLVGHADERGPEEHNRELSIARATAVRNALVDAGIDPARIGIEARGSSDPLGSTTDFGRSVNRRVTVELERGE